MGVYAQNDRAIQMCLAKDGDWSTDTHVALMKAYGIQCATLYYNLSSRTNRLYPFESVRTDYLENGYNVVLTLKFESHPKAPQNLTILEQITVGYFDTDLTNLITAIKDAKKQIVVRPLHELDGKWYPWGMYAEGNSPEIAVDAVKHIVALFRKANAPVKIEINFNRKDAFGKVLGEAEKYMPPLDKVVDMFSISTYNRCGTADNYKYERSFAYDFRPVYKRLRQFTQKPINVAETSTSGMCGARLPWFEAMFTALKGEFPQTKMVTLFFGEVPVGKASNKIPIQWGISPDEYDDFRRLLLGNWPDEHTYLETDLNAFDWSSIRLPWSVFSRISYPLSEIPNVAFNPVVGDTFGKESLVFMTQFTQKVLFPVTDSLVTGPVLRLGVMKSVNENMWWNNRFSAGLSWGIFGDVRNKTVRWGNWYLEPIAIEYRQYIAPVPDRYVGGGELRVTATAGVNFGGDWSQ
jgi:hypothetical protein